MQVCKCKILRYRQYWNKSKKFSHQLRFASRHHQDVQTTLTQIKNKNAKGIINQRSYVTVLHHLFIYPLPCSQQHYHPSSPLVPWPLYQSLLPSSPPSQLMQFPARVLQDCVVRRLCCLEEDRGKDVSDARPSRKTEYAYILQDKSARLTYFGLD